MDISFTGNYDLIITGKFNSIRSFPLPPSLEIQQRIAELRQKAREGTLTLDETKEGIAFLRAERLAMPPAKSSSRAKVVVNADDLLGELGI